MQSDWREDWVHVNVVQWHFALLPLRRKRKNEISKKDKNNPPKTMTQRLKYSKIHKTHSWHTCHDPSCNSDGPKLLKTRNITNVMPLAMSSTEYCEYNNGSVAKSFEGKGDMEGELICSEEGFVWYKLCEREVRKRKTKKVLSNKSSYANVLHEWQFRIEFTVCIPTKKEQLHWKWEWIFGRK